MLWWLKELNFPYDLPVKDQEHIADHSEHEDLNTHHNKKYRQNSERDMFDVSHPFEHNKDPDEYAKKGSECAHHTEIEHRVVHPCKPVYGADNLDAIMEWREFCGSARAAGIFYRHYHDPLAVSDRFNRDLSLNLKPFLF